MWRRGRKALGVYEVLSPHVAQMVVTHLGESRGPKDDKRDAFALAERLRVGRVQPVFKYGGKFGKLRELARNYSRINTDVVRCQSRLKALYRSRGVSTAGLGVYSQSEREGWLKKLPEAYRDAAQLMYAQYDALHALKKVANKALVSESHRHPIAAILETCPGLGPVRAAQLIPIVVSPYRFRTKRQFWSYCGLGVVMRSSSDWVQTPNGWRRASVAQTRGLNHNYHRTLKCIFKGAATTVITHKREEDPLYGYYQRLTESGTKPTLAKVSLARKIAAIVLCMYKKKEAYQAASVTQSASLDG